MSRMLFAVSLLLASLIGSSSTVPASADPGHRRPRVTVMRWKEPPLTSSPGECNEEICDEETLILRAHDPDSSITEVQVWFDEGGERAPFVFAHTGCVQGKKEGTPARLEIGARFTEAGDYTVAAVAYSHKRCLPHKKGDGHPALHSRIKRIQVTVEEPKE